jgi:sugar phosphate isomerase/epimerase
VPPFSVCQLSTLPASLDEDLAAYREAGVDGIGLCEIKLPEGQDAESIAKVRASGLVATICLPATLSVLPLPLLPGPEDPGERVEAICSGIRRLARFDAVTCLCLTGPVGGRDPGRAREVVVDGLRTIARCAADAGVGIGLEPIHATIRDDWTMVATIPEALELIDEVGESNLGIVFDVWHLWDTPNLLEDARTYARRFVGVHVDDWREPTRGWGDRVLPGEGIAPLPEILGALEAGGFDGWYDLEIFSDDGTFGSGYPDSLWKLPPAEVARRGREGFEAAWAERR